MEGYLTLTVFTILAQTAAGMAILKGICPRAQDSKFSPWTILAIILLACGTVASMFHLNFPLRGYLALSNPFESWLSLEIYSVLGFGITLLLCFFSSAYILRLISGIAGGFLVFVMGEVYRNTSAVSWETWNTPVNFFTSALLLGAVALFCTSLLCKKDKVASLTGPLPKLIGFFVICRMVALALLVQRSEVKPEIMLMDAHITLTVFGSVVILVGIMQRMLKYLADPIDKKTPCLSCCGILMLLFVIAGELSGRLMFYMLYSNTGL